MAGTAAFALVEERDEEPDVLAEFVALVVLVAPVEDACAEPFAAASSAQTDVPVTTPLSATASVIRRARRRARARFAALSREGVAMTTTMSAAGKAPIA
jgi:hypothetical protein